MRKRNKDIDSKHNLNTHEKYVSRMRQEEKRATCPCASCGQSDDGCDNPAYCKKYKTWRKIYLKNLW